jgi:hypothetical protein
MSQFMLSVPLIKIDVERRLVVGRAAQEETDKTNEIMDYETARPQFEKWSASYADKQVPGMEMSKGNLRVMHSRNVAGKLTEIAYNDADKSVEIIAKISDANEWQKVLDGCYTGFSIGGGYLKKWKDGTRTRYTPDVREISLVDNPCMPSARIVELHKADGLVESMEVRGRAPGGFAAAWAARPTSFADKWAARPTPPRTFAEMAKAYDESKHDRDQDGRFSASGQLNAPDRATTQSAGAAAGGVVGVAAGAAAAAAIGHRDAIAAAIRPGSRRNQAARGLRADRGARRDIVSVSRIERERMQSGTDARTQELAGAVHRKVMEEHASAGLSEDDAKVAAQKAADQVRAARTSGSTGLKLARRKVRDSIKDGIKDYMAHTAPRFRLSAKLGIGLLAGGALAGVAGGLYAGKKSADHSEAIAQGKKPDGGIARHLGDAARVAAPAVSGALLGAGNTLEHLGVRGAALAALAGGAFGAGIGAWALHSERSEARQFAAANKKAS